jgi:ethanolamine utilization protein EutA (predicted chaperonin)
MHAEEMNCIHDYILTSYEIRSKKDIVLKAELYEGGGSPNSDDGQLLPMKRAHIVFSDIVAYQFTDDAFEAGTILDDIVELDLQKFIEENGKLFKDSFNHWIASDNALALLTEKDLHAFMIPSILGMCGWVLCKSYRVEYIH